MLLCSTPSVALCFLSSYLSRLSTIVALCNIDGNGERISVSNKGKTVAVATNVHEIYIPVASIIHITR